MSVLSYITYPSFLHSGHFPSPKLEKNALPTWRNLFTRWECIAKIYLIRTKPGCQVVADVTASPPRSNPAVTLWNTASASYHFKHHDLMLIPSLLFSVRYSSARPSHHTFGIPNWEELFIISLFEAEVLEKCSAVLRILTLCLVTRPS